MGVTLLVTMGSHLCQFIKTLSPTKDKLHLTPTEDNLILTPTGDFIKISAKGDNDESNVTDLTGLRSQRPTKNQ